jgi:uncharacterized protein
MRIAVVGTGIAGLGAAWLLQRRHELVVYEAAARIGGHSHTVDVPWQGGSVAVDSGFIVYNEPNYPDLSRLFATLGVATHASDMSFGVSIDGGRFEYAGSSARALLAQASNLVNPAFQRMLFDILRFNRDGLRFLETPREEVVTLGDFLARGRYGETFRRCYLLPMAAAIWSASLAGMAGYPAQSFLRFFANHGLLSVNGQLPWRTVTGSSRRYLEKLAAPFAERIRLATPAAAVRRTGYGVEVIDGRGGREGFDHVVLACHADQALALIERPTPSERSVLGGFRYLANRAVLHRDPRLMPRRKGVWSSWNYLSDGLGRDDDAGVAVTYWLNRLQGIDPKCLLLQTLNPRREPNPESVIAEFTYEHPQYDRATLAAQRRRGEIQGRDRLWFCGAHWGYGFHEDGLRSGFEVAAELGIAPAWWPQPAAMPLVAAAPTMPLPAAAKAE